MKVSEYVIDQDHQIFHYKHGRITLPAGMHIKPISAKYAPKHMTDTPEGKWINEETETYIYCSYGMAIVPWNIIRKVTGYW
jgi:hypothetical protein